MQITAIRSDQIYRTMMTAAPADKTDLYRQQLLGPFREKWDIQHIPFESDDGFDVVTMSNMMNIAPHNMDDSMKDQVTRIASESFWQSCQQAIEESLAQFTNHGIQLPVLHYTYTVLLGDMNRPLMRINEGLCGDGGIPGYMIANIVPDHERLARLPAVLAHECNHNVRYQFIRWNPNVTLAEMIVSEGLAENFAEAMYGQQALGPWVTRTDTDMLNRNVKPLIHDHLQLTGLQAISPYLYGDEIASIQTQTTSVVGMPYAGGYACGYHLVHYYLKQTGISITEATLQSAETILAATGDFWHETTQVHRT